MNHASRLTPLAIFIAALALYLRTACPTLGGGWDSEEFQYAAYTLGIAHSTGYPLYLVLGKIFTTLVPIGNIAYRMNVLSAILTALAAVFVYLNARLLTQRQLAAIATAALCATNAAVWRQAGVASVGPLNLLLLSALVYALLLWHLHPERSTAKSKGALLTIAAFIFGLGLAHHRTILFLAPAIAVFVLLCDPGIIRRQREWTRALFWLMLPLAFYLYIPIFSSPEGFLNYVLGSEAGNYTRGNWLELGQAFVSILQYLYDSLLGLGIGLVAVGAIAGLKLNRAKEISVDPCIQLFLGLGILTYTAFATFVTGEPDRYFVLPFMFLLYWFAIGAGLIEELGGMILPVPNADEPLRVSRMRFAKRAIAMALFLFVFMLPVIVSFTDRFRTADWSTFDRVYKQWDEIFTLPIPQNATIVGSWNQLNAMRYMQRVEHRRLDVQIIGTFYDPAPQTDAARAAFVDGRAIFLAPGIAQPLGDYRYAQLGPLLQVRDKPQMNAPAVQKNIALNPSLTLANFEITTALEPYAPTTRIAPTRSARITLDWQANGNIKDFLVRVRLYDPDGRAIVLRDEPPVRGLYPASQWTRGEYVRGVHNIQIPGGTPPGTYQFKLQTLDAATKSPTSDEIALGSFAVERATNLTREQVFIQHPIDIYIGAGIRLWGYGGFEGTHRPGDKLDVNLIWYASDDLSGLNYYQFKMQELKVSFKFTDKSGTTFSRGQYSLVPSYNTWSWQKGEVLKAYYDLQLPNNDTEGTLSLEVIHGSTSITVAQIPIVP